MRHFFRLGEDLIRRRYTPQTVPRRRGDYSQAREWAVPAGHASGHVTGSRTNSPAAAAAAWPTVGARGARNHRRRGSSGEELTAGALPDV